jgi:sugar lactone lactonase YvrE
MLNISSKLIAQTFLLLGVELVANAQPRYVIATVAGNGTFGYSGDGGPATSAQLGLPNGVAIDPGGNLYVTDSARVRKVSPNGIITTVAGNGIGSYSGDGGPATSANLSNPSGVTVDAVGNLYIADTDNNRIRKVAPSGIITTVVGTGTAGYSGDGGPATSAQIYFPFGLAFDATGNLYIADRNNARIRKVSQAGIITTIAGNGTAGYSGDGGPATSAQLRPRGVAVDPEGALYIADEYNYRIRKVALNGIISTVAGNGTFGYSGDGGPATSAQLSYPFGVAVDANGTLYIPDSFNNRIRKVSQAGIITTIAGNGTAGYSGDGGPATSAQLNLPWNTAVDPAGNVLVAEYGNAVVRRLALVPTGPLQYTFTGVGTGSLGTAHFTAAPFAFSLVATASTVGYSIPNGPAFYNSGILSYSIAGVGTGTSSEPVSVFSGNFGHLFPGVMVGQFPSPNLVWGGVNSLPAYNLTTTYGPITLSDFFRSQPDILSTSGGALSLSSISSLTFQASAVATGTLTINTNLPSATFTITGPATYTGSGTSFTQTGVPVGTYTITFGTVSGYTSPPSQTQTLTAGGGLSFTGSYQLLPQVGTIIVTSNRPEATITLTPPVPGFPTTGPYPVSRSVPVGTYLITFSPLNNYVTPPATNQQLTAGGTINVNGNYQAVGPLFLSTDKPSLAFGWQQGVATPIQPQSLFVTSSGATVFFTASASTGPRSGPWLSVAPGAAGTPAPLTVNAVPGLPAGTYNGQITLTSYSVIGSTISVPVRLDISAPLGAALVTSPGNLSFAFHEGDNFVPSQSVTITSTAGALSVVALPVTPDGTKWLRVNTSTVSPTPFQLQVSVDPGLASGSYSGWIALISSFATNNEMVIPVTVEVTAQQSSAPGTKSLVIIPPPVRPTTQTLSFPNIEYDIQNVLFSVLDKEYRNSLDSSGRAANLGFCYQGIVDAMRKQELTSFVTIPGNLLATALATLPLDLFPTETTAGKLLIVFGDYVTSAVISGAPPSAIKLVTEQTAGFVLSQLTNDYYSDLVLASVDSSTLGARMLSYFNRDGVTTLELSASNIGTAYQKSLIVPATKVQGVVMYSPTTNYVVAVVRGVCEALDDTPATTAGYIFRVAAAPGGFLKNASAAGDLDVVPMLQ